MIVVTLTRASGLARGNTIDVTWEVYWQYMSAEVGLLLSTATAFRSLFVSRNARQSQERQSESWYRAAFRRIKSYGSYSDQKSPMSLSNGETEYPTSVKKPSQSFSRGETAFSNVSRPCTSGVHTFIGRSDMTDLATSQIIRNHREKGVVPEQRILLSHSVDIDMEEQRPQVDTSLT